MKKSYSKILISVLSYVPKWWKERIHKRRQVSRHATRLDDIALWVILEAAGIFLIVISGVSLLYMVRPEPEVLRFTSRYAPSAFAPWHVRISIPPSPNKEPYEVTVTIPPTLFLISPDKKVDHTVSQITLNTDGKHQNVYELEFMVYAGIDSISYVRANSPFHSASVVVVPRDGPIVFRQKGMKWNLINYSAFPFPDIIAEVNGQQEGQFSLPPFGSVEISTPRVGEWVLRNENIILARHMISELSIMSSSNYIESKNKKSTTAKILIPIEKESIQTKVKIYSKIFDCKILQADFCEVDVTIPQEEIAERIGKDRASIANYLRLLKLPEKVKEKLKNKKLTYGHGRALMGLDDAKMIEKLADKIIIENLSVRQIETIVQSVKNSGDTIKLETQQRQNLNNQDQERLLSVSKELSTKLSTKVEIKGSGKKGKIIIQYHSTDNLNTLIDKLLK